MEKLGRFIQNILVPIITVGTAAMVAWLNYSVSKVDQGLKEQIASVDLAIKEAKDERERIKSEREFNFKIYDLVQKSIEENDQRKQEVAKQFVIVMVDGELRKRLLGVLEAGGTPEVRKETARLIEKEAKFEIQQADVFSITKRKSSFDWEDWDYDVFWCETSGEEAKIQAESIVSQLKAEGAKGRIRARELPASVNAKAGYKINGYAIRRSENEVSQATALQHLSEQVLSRNGYSVAFSQQPTSSKTKWYISAFICPK